MTVLIGTESKAQELMSTYNLSKNDLNSLQLYEDEYKSGRYKSRQQALAVSYSQTKKISPYCSRYFKRK